MRPAPAFATLLQLHGADVYDSKGAALAGRDFSSTVVSLGPPRGWKRRAREAMDSLTRYPRPHGRGLDGFLAGKLGLAPSCVLVSNGASEALEWCARLAGGRRARLLAPCFGEYRAKLERAGARVDEVWWDLSKELDVDALAEGLGVGDQVWVANPSNPFGRVLGTLELSRLESRCRSRGVLLVLDEALMAQRLDSPSHADPGAFPGQKDNPCLVVVRSLGKGLGLPGLRLGYLAAERGLAARLRRFQDPWSVNSMAQELGAWAFEQEALLAAGRRRLLQGRAQDLFQRLSGCPDLQAAPTRATGYFCVRLKSPRASGVAARLADLGLFVRDCSSFGRWGRSWLRLNPRSAPENQALARALPKVLGRA
ncbi:MAG TPA: aminotransferase class I/II-fold pyridoxal phosphate-dependent enzyme [bacterium]|nr:aminotransferase class I/II-fold pyridoxal phosphate-dependent enzyme [bacterium]